jgi:NAD(P)-dependent dehydrogenase (short-subunit alcohol dehydrogenase family)
MGVLQGKVVLVTGAGRGIGREAALLAAREGASVVVNDLGTAMNGADAGVRDPAEEVVAEIMATGGRAIADIHSVADPEGARAMVEAAVNEFGAIHAVINPAGILRDKMFHKMSDDDWNAVIDVHLNGSYNVARAAIPHFREQQDGAFVLFTSSAGLIGAVGQANYAAAKMGIVGLSRSLAMEGERYNIRSNVIAPFAWTRMVASIPVTSDEHRDRLARMREKMRADQVASFVVALASEQSKDTTGQIFAVRGNEILLMSQPRPICAISRLQGWSPETVITHALPAFATRCVELGGTNAVFNWETI